MLSTNSEWNFSKLQKIKVRKLFYILDQYCLSSCSGVIITSEWEYELDENFPNDGPIAKVMGKYKKYKKVEDFPEDFKGSNTTELPKVPRYGT